MANVRSGNTYYIDSTGDLAIKNLKVSKVTVTSTANSAAIIMQDVETQLNKVEFRIDTTDKTQSFDYIINPMLFTNGLRISSISNCNATCILQETNK